MQKKNMKLPLNREDVRRLTYLPLDLLRQVAGGASGADSVIGPCAKCRPDVG
jgi:hypothetical protein